MKGLMILANGFEDTEALATLDILRRSMLDIEVVTISDDKEVTSQYKLKLKFEKALKDVKSDDFDFLVIPGGGAVKHVLKGMKEISALITSFVQKGKLVAAICAAPSLIAELGFFVDEKYTCYPGCETSSLGGKYLPNKGVVVSGKFITAKSMAYSIDFGLTIVEYLQGREQMKKIQKAIFGEK
ncbi:MAG: DJ-1/PfpI family protein [Bacilli bacterium]|nr:DJ-1/PfpI family protein [Bacilli bacterium]